MKPIGGFFELELTDNGAPYHPDAFFLNTGRACINLFLKEKRPRKIFVPFYCCNSLIDPIIENSIPYEYYSLNEKLEIADEIVPEFDELIIYINYFGIKSDYIHELISSYGVNLIIDNTHGFFERDYKLCSSFNSARKYFGVPDGAYLYSNDSLRAELLPNQSISCSHLVNRFIGNIQKGYDQFLEYENSITSEIRSGSLLSKFLLDNINYNDVSKKRTLNFKHYMEGLGEVNTLSFAPSLEDSVPFVYPLLLDKIIDKQKLFEKKIFVPTYWNDILTRGIKSFEFEKFFSTNLLPLPIDHRYGEGEIDYVINQILRLYEN